MKNWKIGTRIGAGFAAVIMIAAALGLFAYTKLGTIENSAKEVALRALPKVYLVGQIQTNMKATYSLAVQHAATSDKQEKAGLEAEIQAIRSANTKLVDEYEKLTNIERQRARAARGV